MTKQTSRTDGIVVVFTRPSDFSQEVAWERWYDDVHLPDSADASGAWVVTRWEVSDRPSGYSPAAGFTHVAIYEFDDVERGAPVLLDLFESRRASGDLHAAHTITALDVLVPTGSWKGRLEPRDACRGQVMAYVGPNDPALTAEWTTWLDEVHVPDMLASGAFVDASRWQRTEPARFGLNFLTIYDVELDDVAEAVARSGRAMAPAHAAGRLLACHAGGIRASLVQTGRYGGRGYRPDPA